MNQDSPIRLVSTDFDGTVHAEHENPPVAPALQERLAQLQRQGVKWVVNTGRDLSALMEALGRAHLRVSPDFVVVVEREIHAHDGVRFAGWDDWNRECTRKQDELFARVRPDLPSLVEWIHERFQVMIYEDAYSPFCMIAESPTDTDRIMEFMARYCRKVPELSLVRNDVYVRFSHIGFNKGTALGEITRRLGLSADQVLAAGDHWNDLPMLSPEFARWLVAPSNAIEPVKAAVRRNLGHVSSQPVGHGILEGLDRFCGAA